MYSAQELISHIESLTALPSVYYRVRDQLESPDCPIQDIARLLEADPALTAGILKLVNSAFYGFARKIESVERALPVLGLQQAHELILAISVSHVFDGISPQNMDMKRYWLGCMMTALTARELAYLTCSPVASRLFVVGLLADIGHLVLYQTVPDLAVKAQTTADSEDEALFMAERRIIGCDSAEVGAALVENWKLPESFAEIIGSQTQPLLSGKHVLEAELLHIALAMSKADRYNESSQKALRRIDPEIWNNIGLTPDHFARIRESVEMNLSSCTAMFFPSTF